MATINGGGTLSREGEVSILHRLLSACDGSHEVYRRYCVRILVPHTKLKGLDLNQGRRLYEAAERSMPTVTRLMLHHKGMWIRKHGGDLDEAIDVYKQALNAEPDPFSERDEAPENVHTSIAAAIVDKMDRGMISREVGQAEAIKELEKSRSPAFVNPNSVHVYANLVSKLAFQQGGFETSDQFALVNRALADIDRTVVLLGSGSLRRIGLRDDTAMLEQKRDEILVKCGGVADLEERAEELWTEYRNQQGFVLCTRKKLATAISNRERGADFLEAFEYWERCKKAIAVSEEMTPEFAEVGLILYYVWQIHPRSLRRVKPGPVAWGPLKENAERTLESTRFRSDPFYRYVLGLALAHLGDWPQAKLVFEQNRRVNMPSDVLHVTRDYLLNNGGSLWRVQGHAERGASTTFFRVDDLHQTFIAGASEAWLSSLVAQHAYVVFSFAGPKATMSDSSCRVRV